MKHKFTNEKESKKNFGSSILPKQALKNQDIIFLLSKDLSYINLEEEQSLTRNIDEASKSLNAYCYKIETEIHPLSTK